MKRIAVVGGGIFGSTAAIHLARAGHSVDLFEERPRLLSVASGINQYRLHRGYHYPRSSETAASAKKAETSFRAEYGSAVMDTGRHLYAIAREGSLVNAEHFLAFCDEHDLAYKSVHHEPLIRAEAVDLIIEAEEAWIDPEALRSLVEKRVHESGVHLHLCRRADAKTLLSYEKVVMACYAGLNAVLPGVVPPQEYQFEVCEKPIAELPASVGVTGIVILDGPFMCVDPFGQSGHFVLGHVEHAIHASNVGLLPEVPEYVAPFLNSGVVETPPHSHFDAFIESGAEFIPFLKEARHVGSMFTVRTVLAGMEETDARPTIVDQIEDRYIRMFSGKIGNAVLAARAAVHLVDGEL